MKKIVCLLVVASLLSCLCGCNRQPGIPAVSEPITDMAGTGDGQGSDQNNPTDTPDRKEDPGMISYWSFDSIGTNSLVADANNRKHGVARNCKVASDAIQGSSLLFQPSIGSHVSFGTQITDALKDTRAITVSFWYYSMTSLLHKPYIFCLSMEDGDPGVCIQLTGTNAVVACRSSSKDSVQSRTFPCSGWGEWIHLAVSVDYTTGTVRLYRNGVELTPSEGNTVRFSQKSYAPGTPKYEDSLGGSAGDHLNTKVFSGRIDEVYLFSKAASAEEIQALYSIGKNTVTPAANESTLYTKLAILTSTGNLVLCANSNLVLSNGDRCYLVPGDASASVLVREGKHYVPLDFYRAYCSAVLSEDTLNAMDVITENGRQYLSIEDYANETQTPVKVTENGIVILGKQSGRTEPALLDFIDRYYQGDLDLPPVPEEDFFNSRREVQFSDVNSLNVSLGSPAMVRMSNGKLLCSFDYNGKGYQPTNGGSNDTGICVSDSNGETWEKIALVPRMMWSTLFCIGDTVYLIGRDSATGKLAIVKSEDFGNTWTKPSQGQIDTLVGSAHHAPTPAVIHNGRVYLAFEDSCNAAGIAQNVPTKRAYMMSASVDSDLLKASSWTKSNYVPFDTDWLDHSHYYGGSNTGLGFYEGNAVCGKDGSMYIILRVDADPSYGLACVLKLSGDNTGLTFERMIDLPVGKDKFVIRYDEASGLYIAIGNIKTTDSFPTQRNVLAMYTSDDLVHWTYAATLLSDNTLTMLEISVQNYGFQYPDFLIEGEDILMVVREASGNTTYYHNANYISFYRIRNFRRFLESASQGES